MIPFNGDITQALKWMQNNAPGIQGVISKKKDWYTQFHTQFWTDWEANVFNINTANPFGLMVWCIILGVPSGNLGLRGGSASWAYGANRQNYVYSHTNPTLPNPNTVGGNFYGGGVAELLNFSEITKILKLRYVALVSNGNLQYINYMLRYIFNDGKPWNFAAGNYFIVVDCTSDPATTSNVPGPFRIEYRIGPGMGLSPQFLNFINLSTNGILPCMVGSLSIAIQE